MAELVTSSYELDPDYAQAVLGINDATLHTLNQLLGADLFARGTTVTMRGPVEARGGHHGHGHAGIRRGDPRP